jgi:hypothetical protein
MQSDLSNASNLLKLDQVSSGDFPTSLTLANGGKGIIPNPSLDDYKYTVDNTSNPKNFCLQYREGTNTYAIDNDSAVSKGVCLTNLVTNGDFRNGTTGWSGIDAIVSGIAEKTATFQYANISQSFSGVSYRNHKIYLTAYVRADIASVIMLTVSDGTYQSASYHTGDNVLRRMNTIQTIGAGCNTVYLRVQDNRANGWTKFYTKMFLALDLTAIFGAGNEPTQAQIDTIMSNYPNSWFNIVAKANL